MRDGIRESSAATSRHTAATQNVLSLMLRQLRRRKERTPGPAGANRQACSDRARFHHSRLHQMAREMLTMRAHGHGYPSNAKELAL